MSMPNTPKEFNNSTKEVFEIEQKTENMQPTIKSIKDAYPKMRIDISGISQNKPMKYDSDIRYTASLKGVDGVINAEANLESKSATVTLSQDTDVNTLIEAVKNAGYEAKAE